MDMIKITKDMVPQGASTIVRGKNDTSVNVKMQIPYEQKQAFAMQRSIYQTIQDNDNQVMYDNYKMLLINTVLAAKYYTNIDVSEMNEQSDWRVLFDWLVMNGLYDSIMAAIKADMHYVDMISEYMVQSIRDIYKRTHSIDFKIMKTFGGLFTGQDISDVVAKGSQINNEMIDMLGAKKQVDKKKEKSNRNSKMAIDGGVIVDLAKKN